MKKKVLAFLLASAMVIEPFSVVGAADFSDGMGQDTVQFSDDAEDVPEVENDGVDQFSTDAASEGESSSKPSEDAIKMGDDVWVEFDDSTGTAAISGTGDMWDYYENGYDYTNKHQNPFIEKSGIKRVVIEDGVTSVSNYLLSQCKNSGSIESITVGKNVKKIGKFAFSQCQYVKNVLLQSGLEEIGESAFDNCHSIEKIEIPDSVKEIGGNCFESCWALQSVKLPKGLINIYGGTFQYCFNLTEIILPSTVEYIGYEAFYKCQSLTQITK